MGAFFVNSFFVCSVLGDSLELALFGAGAAAEADLLVYDMRLLDLAGDCFSGADAGAGGAALALLGIDAVFAFDLLLRRRRGLGRFCFCFCLGGLFLLGFLYRRDILRNGIV